MARRSAQAALHGKPDKYLELVKAFPLRPIRSDTELDRAIAMIDSLITRGELDSGEADYLDVLGDLVHKYEAEHDPIAPVPDANMVQFLLESSEMAQTAAGSTKRDRRIDNLGNPRREKEAESSPYRGPLRHLPSEPCGLFP